MSDLEATSRELREKLGPEKYDGLYLKSLGLVEQDMARKRAAGAEHVGELGRDPGKVGGTRLVFGHRRAEPGKTFQGEHGAPAYFVLAPGESLPQGYEALEEASLLGLILDGVRAGSASIWEPPEDAQPRLHWRGDNPHPVHNFPADDAELRAEADAAGEVIGQLLRQPDVVEAVRQAILNRDQRALEEIIVARQRVVGPTGQQESFHQAVRWPAAPPADASATRTASQIVGDVVQRREVLARYGEAYTTECWDPASQHAGRWV